MAVFTEVEFGEADALVQRLGLGPLRELRGIEGGIENTNYFATTESGEYVLTLFERLSAEQLPYYLCLMKHLAARGQVLHQAQVVGELLGAQALEQRENVLARLGGGEVVGVLDAALDAAQLAQGAQAEALHERVGLAEFDFGKDCHGKRPQRGWDAAAAAMRRTVRTS